MLCVYVLASVQMCMFCVIFYVLMNTYCTFQKCTDLLIVIKIRHVFCKDMLFIYFAKRLLLFEIC